MRTKTILMIVGVVAAVFLLPRLLAKMRGSVPKDSPANPPVQSPSPPQQGKKTIFGKINNGITQLGDSIGGKYGGAVAGIGNIIGAFTK